MSIWEVVSLKNKWINKSCGSQSKFLRKDSLSKTSPLVFHASLSRISPLNTYKMRLFLDTKICQVLTPGDSELLTFSKFCKELHKVNSFAGGSGLFLSLAYSFPLPLIFLCQCFNFNFKTKHRNFWNTVENIWSLGTQNWLAVGPPYPIV